MLKQKLEKNRQTKSQSICGSALGMEWKVKKNLGALGDLRAKGLWKYDNERNVGLDGAGGVDLRAASSIYFFETRARVKGTLVCL
jgi:carbon catabolite-derepressing protein kinase